MNFIFVYGILKRRYANAQKARVNGYRLVDLGAFPAAIPHEGGAVIGELIYVNNETVAEFDMIEGHPHFYVRTDVEVEVGDGDNAELVQAQMYVVNQDHHHRQSLPTGSLTIEDVGNEMTYEYR